MGWLWPLFVDDFSLNILHLENDCNLNNVNRDVGKQGADLNNGCLLF
jgi:hypothetical protein